MWLAVIFSAAVLLPIANMQLCIEQPTEYVCTNVKNKIPRKQSYSYNYGYYYSKISKSVRCDNCDIPSFNKETLSDFEGRTLNVSNNNIVSIVEFKSFGDNVQEFLFTNNSIDSITARIFNQFKNLANIDLSRNKLTKLQRNVFDGTKTILLNLSHNNLTKLQSAMDGLTVNQLNVSFNNIQEIQEDTFLYTTFSNGTLDLQGNWIKTLSNNGFKSKGELIIINLDQNRLEKVYAHSFDNLKLLSILYLANNKITDIEEGSFNDLTSLITLNLGGNLLQSFDFNLLNSLSKLQKLYLCFNSIKNISTATLHNPNINLVTLGYNKLVELEDYFLPYPSITYLNLTNNNISRISLHAFSMMSSLKILDLSNNSIANVSNSLRNMKALVLLVLNDNNISEIGLSLESLQYLDLSNNALTSINFTNMSNLQTLMLSNNRLEKLKNTFTNVIGLKKLILSNNQISVVPKETFSDLLGLVLLDLQGNHISRLDLGAFTNLNRLKTLVLSNNKLKFIDGYLFFGLMNLNVLNISNNYLSQLNGSVFFPLENLTVLDVSNNRLQDFRVDEVKQHSKNLSKIFIPNNFWECSTLLSMYKMHLNNVIGFKTHYHYTVPNIHGVACSRTRIKIYDRMNFSDFLKLISDESETTSEANIASVSISSSIDIVSTTSTNVEPQENLLDLINSIVNERTREIQSFWNNSFGDFKNEQRKLTANNVKAIENKDSLAYQKSNANNDEDHVSTTNAVMIVVICINYIIVIALAFFIFKLYYNHRQSQLADSNRNSNETVELL